MGSIKIVWKVKQFESIGHYHLLFSADVAPDIYCNQGITRAFIPKTNADFDLGHAGQRKTTRSQAFLPGHLPCCSATAHYQQLWQSKKMQSISTVTWPLHLLMSDNAHMHCLIDGMATITIIICIIIHQVAALALAVIEAPQQYLTQYMKYRNAPLLIQLGLSFQWDICSWMLL